MSVSATEFVQTLFAVAPGDACAWITTFEGDPGSASGEWAGRRHDPTRPLPHINGSNAYISVSAFPTGAKARRQEGPHHALVLVCDDVGTKANPAVVRATLGEPSYEMETSEGNFQFGYLLTAPATKQQIEPLHTALKARQFLSDTAGISSVRYVRLPTGINSKPNKRNFQVRLTAWNPDRRYSLAALRTSLGIGLDGGKQPYAPPNAVHEGKGNGARGPGEVSGRNAQLLAYGGSIAGSLAPEKVLEALLNFNYAHCQPPLPDDEVRTVWKRLCKYHRPNDENGSDTAPFPLEVVHSATDFVKLDIPKREPIVEGLILTQTLAMLYAVRGLGKTMVALYLAVCVALGTKFFEWTIPLARRVLYVDGEMSAAELQERARKFVGSRIAALLDLIASELFFALMGAPLNLADVNQQARFIALLNSLDGAGRKPALIILDNKSALSAGTDENSNADQDAFLAFLRTLRHLGYAVLVVHHAGKSGDQRGASRNEDFLDLTIKLVEPKEDDGEEVPQAGRGAVFKLTFTKHRSLRPDPAVLGVELMEDIDGTFTWAMQKPRRQQNWLRVLIYLHDHPRDIQAAVGDALGIDKSNLSGHVKYLRGRSFLKDGTLELTPSGRSYVETVRATAGDSGGLDA